MAASRNAPQAWAVPPAPLSSKLSDYVVPKLEDFETTMKATFHNDHAARKFLQGVLVFAITWFAHATR